MSEPIYSIDLYEELLSHLPNAEAWYVIHAEQFSSALLVADPFVKEVFEWQEKYMREYKKPAPIPVLEHQFDDLHIEEPQTEIGDLLDRIRDWYAKNEQKKALRELAKVQTDNPRGIPKALSRKGRELQELLQKRGEVFRVSDIERAMNRYDKKVLAGPGASFGFAELDEYFYEGMKGVTFFIGAPKSMKSWLMCQSVFKNILDGQYVYLYSLELPAEETDWRIRCLAADVPYWKYLRNSLETEDRRRIQDATDFLLGCGTYTVEKPGRGHRGIDEMIHKARDNGADLVAIDQLQYVEQEDGKSLGQLNQTGEYWNVLNRARDLSDEGPILFAHQFNRGARWADNMPSMEDAKGSSSIEEIATLALGLWRNKDMRNDHVLGVGTLAARNYGYPAWTIGVELSEGCSFTLIDRIPDEEI